MALGESVPERDFTIRLEAAMKPAAMIGSAVAGLTSVKPGRRITRTPRKPKSVAVQRRARTTSPSTRAAPTVANSGRVKLSATASAKGSSVTE